MPLNQSMAVAAQIEEAKAASALKNKVLSLHTELNAMARQYLSLLALQANEGDIDKLNDSRAEAVTTLAGSINGAGAESAAVVKSFLDELSAAIG